MKYQEGDIFIYKLGNNMPTYEIITGSMKKVEFTPPSTRYKVIVLFPNGEVDRRHNYPVDTYHRAISDGNLEKVDAEEIPSDVIETVEEETGIEL